MASTNHTHLALFLTPLLQHQLVAGRSFYTFGGKPPLAVSNHYYSCTMASPQQQQQQRRKRMFAGSVAGRSIHRFAVRD